jgi:hypothetical protein
MGEQVNNNEGACSYDFMPFLIFSECPLFLTLACLVKVR